MNELKSKLLSLGLSEEQVGGAIQHVSEFVKGKLPESLHGVLDQVLAGESPDLGKIAESFGGLDAIKGLFGGK